MPRHEHTVQGDQNALLYCKQEQKLKRLQVFINFLFHFLTIISSELTQIKTALQEILQTLYVINV